MSRVPFDLRPAARVAAVGALVLAAAACGRNGAQGAPGGFPPTPVSVMQVKPVNVPLRFEFVGQTAGSKEAEVRARVQGILERRTYQEGGRVQAGQTLFVIDARPYQAQLQAAEADLARAQAQHSQASRNLERLRPLAEQLVVTKRDLDDAIAAEETGAAAIKQAQARLTEAKLNLSYTTVTAPVSGFASRAQKSEGSLVSPGENSLLTTVSQIDPIHVNFSVSEQEQQRMAKLAPAGASAAAFEVSVRLSDGTVLPRKGRLGFVDTRINTATGAFDAQAVLPNADTALRPGQFVRVILEGVGRSDAIVVPQRAVMDGPQGKFVFLAAKGDKGNDVALPRPVTVSDWVQLDGQQQWIVESGLNAGDAVVVDGTAKLFPVPGGAPIQLSPPPGADGKGQAAAGEVRKADAGKGDGAR
jgi:membrane fusion protein (multidrug efflux system)